MLVFLTNRRASVPCTSLWVYWYLFPMEMIYRCSLSTTMEPTKSPTLLVYSQEELLRLKEIPLSAPTDIPMEIQRYRRGCRAGVQVRILKERGRRYELILPSIVKGNVRSLVNKMDELSLLVKSQHEYLECSVMCFTESWLNENIPDCAVEPAGFTLVRTDRDNQSGKKKGSGIAIFVNSNWCNSCYVTVKARICSPDIDLFAFGMRQFYL